MLSEKLLNKFFISLPYDVKLRLRALLLKDNKEFMESLK